MQSWNCSLCLERVFAACALKEFPELRSMAKGSLVFRMQTRDSTNYDGDDGANCGDYDGDATNRVVFFWRRIS